MLHDLASEDSQQPNSLNRRNELAPGKVSYATFLQGLSPKPELVSVPVKISDLQLLFSQRLFLDREALSPK